jgi:predicted MFS family arabinose efflux permease
MASTPDQVPSIDRRAIAGAIALYIAGGLFWAFLPFFISLQTDRAGLTATAAGLLGTAYLAGFTASSVLALWWAGRVALRPAIGLAALIIAGGFWILGISQLFVLDLLACFVIGNAMGGLWVVAYRVLGLAQVPARAFAIAIGLSYPALALVTFIAGHWVIPRSGLAGVLLTIALLVGILCLGATQIPRRLAVDTGSDRRDSGRASAAGILALFALFFTGFAFACIWSFAAKIGASIGIDPGDVGAILSSNLLLTGLGSLVASAMVGRTRRALPLAGALGLLALCAILLALPLTPLLFAVALIGLGFGIGAVIPYQLAAISDADRTGALTSLIAAAQGLGSALGPPVAGLLWDGGGPLAIASAGLLLILASFSSSFLSLRLLPYGADRPQELP